MHYKIEIKPAIEPDERHKIEDCLKSIGYKIIGGGTRTDLLASDISFED